MELLKSSLSKLNSNVQKIILKAYAIGVDPTDTVINMIQEEIRSSTGMDCYAKNVKRLCVSNDNGTVRDIDHVISRYVKGLGMDEFESYHIKSDMQDGDRLNGIAKICLGELGVKRYRDLRTGIDFELKPVPRTPDMVSDINKILKDMCEYEIAINCKSQTKDIWLRIVGKVEDFEKTDIEQCMHYYNEWYYKQLNKDFSRISSEVSSVNMRVGDVYITCGLLRMKR